MLVTSTALISNVCSSIPRWTLRQTRRFAPPCLRLRRANSPPDCLLTLLSPLAFPLDLDPGAVDQEMQRTLRRPMLDVHGKGLLTTAERAEVRHIPVQADQGKQALDETRRLPRRHCRLDQWRSNVDHAEKDIHRQAGLDCGVAVDGLSPTLAGRLGRPDHARIEPDRQRPAALERVRHCARTNGASMAHCTRASSGSCRSMCSVCSCPPATTLDSRDESLIGFVQQSLARLPKLLAA